MTESEKLIRNEAEAIECLKSNKPTSGYVMLQESIDMAIKALESRYRRKLGMKMLVMTSTAMSMYMLVYAHHVPWK